MFVYYGVLVVILALAVINFVTLLWVARLQKRLREAPKASDLPAPVLVTPEETDQLRQEARENIEAVLAKVGETFGTQLTQTAQKLNQQVEEAADKIIQDELTKYQGTLEELRQTAIEQLSQVQTSVDERKNQMEASLQVEVTEEKKQLLDHFEQRIADVMANYLAEILGNEVDLGAQSRYVVKMLEDHKEDLKKAILREP